MNEHSILVICLDCGDTLIDEHTEVKTEDGVSLGADLITQVRRERKLSR